MNDLPPKQDSKTCEHKSVFPCTLCSLAAYLTKDRDIEWEISEPSNKLNKARYGKYTAKTRNSN
jgi:hypothetical protein